MKKISVFTITTFVLLTIICLSITGTALSQGKNRSRIENAYRDDMEKEYVQAVRDFLEQAHMTNSGVTMTKVIYENGQMEYQVTIHNRAVERMSFYEQQKLLEELKKISFPDTQNTISHEFLTL